MRRRFTPLRHAKAATSHTSGTCCRWPGSDAFETPKSPWRQRKERYIRELPEASDEAIVVSLADKLHNARALLRDVLDALEHEIGQSA